MSVTTQVIVKSRIPAVVARTEPAVSALVGRALFAIQARAVMRAPIDTGFLRNSIRIVHEGTEGRVEVGAHYGVYLEFGTSRMSPRPYLIPAAEEVGPIFERGLQAIFSGRL